LSEVLQYEPDLIVIATGHNEFLEDRTYGSVKNRSALSSWALERFHSLRTVTLARRLLRGPEAEGDVGDDRSLLDPEVNARLDSASGYGSYHRDDEWQRAVIEHYGQSVRAMVQTCREARVPLVLVNLGENVRDCPPFKSEHKPGLSATSLQRWRQIFDEATQLEAADPKGALEEYRKAESIDDEHALLVYRMARCFDRLGKTEQARRYYARAKDLDVCPLRMLDEMHERLKRIAGETDTRLLDAQRLLVELSPNGLPGNNCFMDHVHPTIGAHQQIARALADKLEQTSLVAGAGDWNDSRRRLALRRHFRRLGPAYLANGRRRVGWLEDWACRHRLDQEALPRDTRGHLHLGQKRLDYGEHDAAWEQFRAAMQKDPGVTADVLDHALDLFKQGRGNLAEEVLLRLHFESEAAGLRPKIELACLLLALDAGRSLEAEALYRRYRDAVEQAAESSTDWLVFMPEALDQVRAKTAKAPARPEAETAAHPIDRGTPRQQDDPPDAADPEQTVRVLDEAIRRNPDNPRLYLIRSGIHFANGNLDAALADSTKAVQLAPDSPDGYMARATVYTSQGKLEQAVAELTKAIEIEPTSPDLFRLRGNAYQRLGKSVKAEADFAAAQKLTTGG
jgi:tetratricopeptide (TPR) repeat protein